MKAKTKQEELRNAAAEAGQADGFSDPSLQSKPPDLEERIRQRAYELSQQRAGDGGDALSDWYRAEAEVRAAFSSPEFDNYAEPEGARGLGARAA